MDINQYSSYPALFFVDGGIIINSKNQSPLLPLKETMQILNVEIETAHLSKDILIINCKVGIRDVEMAEANYQIMGFRTFLIQTTPDLQYMTLKAYHWLNWNKQSQFCGQCGSPLKSKFDAPDKYCEQCQTAFFPRFSPAIMVLIQRNDQILLARSKHFTPGVYSAIAGFVDIGETAEMAVHREVKEEIGIEITDLNYFSSQTWPFPDSFMIAFTATYASGEIEIDHNEIEDAKWFSVDSLPKLPSKPSIARMLIDSVLE
jgi:NAD+ diphosphatase